MTDSDVSEKPVENNEEVDIYSDVLSDHDSLISKLNEKVNKLSKEKELLLKSLSSLQKSYEDLQKKCEELEKKYNVVSFNSSALFKTAQAEIKRKDRVINELRKEKDDLVFRKASAHQALQRARSSIFSPKKYRSPIKNQGSTPLLAPIKPVIRPTEENLKPIEEPSEEAENLKPTKVELGIARAAEKLVEENIKVSKCGGESKSLVEPVDESISENTKTSFTRNQTKPTPPPFKGPLTAYSKRLYKRIHGVSPEKSTSLVQQNRSKEEMSEKADMTLKINHDETEAKSVTPSSHKVESISSKLQKDVKEIIKLGSPTKLSPPSTTKSSPDSPKSKTPKTHLKEETQKPNSCRPFTEKIIIQCDLKNGLKGNHKKSPNSVPVSLNETIDNVLKKQRAHQNINCKNEETKKEKVGKDPKSLSSSRLLTNRRPTDKLTISPATFGKLVSHPSLEVNTPIKSKNGTSPKEGRSDSRKRKLSESISSPNKISPRRPRRDTFPETETKNSFITSLFGESPSKSDIEIKKANQSSPSKSCEDLKLTSPVERGLHSSSPIFPDSPSLDSDNPEDLVIDTTAGSQNTSPRVSESDKKDLNVSDEKVLVKVPFSLKDESTPEIQPPNVTSKELIKETETTTTSNIVSEKESNTDNPIIVNTESNDSPSEKNNSPSKNPSISSIEKKVNINSLPQIVISDEPVPQILPQQLPVSDEVQSNLLVINLSHQPKVEGNNLRNVNLESSLSSASLDKVLSPEKSSESNSLSQNDNKSTTSEKEIKVDKPADRFVPSPPELTLVSAFKHSENSVFALAEDTLGFVSALTRMRDISPIRTPDKKSKMFNRPLSQSQQSELIGPECVDLKGKDKSNEKSHEISKQSGQGILNNSSLTEGLLKVRSESSNPKNPNSASNEKLNYVDSAKDGTKVNNKLDGTCIQTSITEFHKKIDSHKDEDNKKVMEPATLLKNDFNEADVSSKKEERLKHNPFKRTKPVRLVTVENKITDGSGKPCSSNVQQTILRPKLQDPSKVQVTPARENREHMDMPNNVNEIIRNLVANGNKNKVVVDTAKDNITDETVLNCNNQPVKSVLPSLNKVVTQPTSDSKNNESVKTFKRSESLKMMKKPLPRNYLNIIGNKEFYKSDDCSKVVNNETRKSEELKIEERSLNTKPNEIPNSNKSSELEQISHIANINKKLRVSKYQSKPDKENLNQEKLPVTVAVNDKRLNDISDDNDRTQTPVVKNNQAVMSRTSTRGSKINKTPSTSLQVSSRNRRQRERRSVSLGPEIRLGIHTGPLQSQKSKQHITVSNNTNNIEPVDKVIGTDKNSCLQSSEKVGRKSRVKKSNEVIGLNKCNTPTSKNLKPERNEHPLKRSSSSSPKRNQNTLESEKVESPKVGKRNVSRSPEHNKRSRSSYKVSPIISPDIEKETHHNSRRPRGRIPEHNRSRSSYKVSPNRSPDLEKRTHQRSCSKSPEHKRSRSRYKYSPRRSDSGGSSRRRSRYDDFRRRSPSPNRGRYQEKEHRSRSSHYKRRRSDRSRSPEPKHGKFGERSRNRSRNFPRRSRSRSSSYSRDRSSRNLSPSENKSAALMSNNEVNSYKEEIELMKKELEMLKGKVNQTQETSPNLSSSTKINCDVHKLQQSVEQRKDLQAAIPSTDNKTTDSAKTTVLAESNKDISNIRSDPEGPVLRNKPEPLQKPHCLSTSIQNNESSKISSGAVRSTHPSPKPIQLKKRTRKLGDSEVQVVSIK